MSKNTSSVALYRANWSKFQTPRHLSNLKPQQYENFETNNRKCSHFQDILNEKIPETPYIITTNSSKYYVSLYKSQWNALRQILLNGYPVVFKSLPHSFIINSLHIDYPKLITIDDSIKTTDILMVYIKNGLTQYDLDTLSIYSRKNAAACAADGKLL